MVGDAVTAQTPTYGLTYTTGTDLLCDGADILTQLEDDFAAALLTIEADVDRLTVIPYALVSAYNVANNGGTFDGSLTNPTYNIIYDAVEADTANMVDLGTAADAIFWNPTTNQTGVWMNGFTTAYASGHITYTITRNIDENNSVTQTTARIDGSFMALGTPQQNTVGVNGLYAITSTATPASMVAQMNPTYDGTAGGHLQAQQPHMWMFWMRDPA
jgi:hypothetical protein